MKIVHALGWYFPDSLGGTEVYVAALARRQRESGHEVLVAAPNASHPREDEYRHEDVGVYRYPIPRNPSRREVQGKATTRGAERFHRWIERTRPDVFHCHSLLTGIGLEELKVARASGATVIATSHTPSLGFLCQRGTMMRWGRELCDGIVEPVKCASCALLEGLPEFWARTVGRAPQALSRLCAVIPGPAGTALGMRDLVRRNLDRQRELLETVDALVVLTRWAWDAVATNHGSDRKLVLNPLGIDMNDPVVERPERAARAPVRFGYVGRFHETKGVFVLAEALSRIPREVSFSLEMRGPTKSVEDRITREKLRALLEGDERVGFAPGVEHEEIGTVLAGYDVVLCPSLWLEGGPTVAMEAQGMGTPVVGSRIGGLEEIVEDGANGRLLPPGDAKALALAITETAANPGVIAQWRGRLKPPRTMDDVASDYHTLYEACLGKRGPAEPGETRG